MADKNFNDEFDSLEELHNNELDDIVLEKYEKKERIKRYAIIGGSILLVFLIVISIVKIVTDSSSAPQDRLVEEQSIEPQEEDEFESVPIIAQEEETKESEEINNVIKEVLNKEKDLEKKTPKKELKSEPQKSTPPKVEPKKPKKEETKPKKVVEKEKEPPKKKSVAAKSKKVQKAAVKGGYFIQVGAFSNYPDKRFLQRLEKEGFNYVIKEFEINGKKIKRVYVGPFANKKEAQKALKKVRAKINKDAFVKRL